MTGASQTKAAGGAATPDPIAGSGFATRLIRLRKAAGLSQTQLAGGDLSPSYISLLESGKRQPSASVVATLASRLGCSTSMLWEGEHSERERRLSLELSYARLALTHGEHASARDRLRVLLDETDLDQHRRDEATLLLSVAHERHGDHNAAIEQLRPLFDRSLKGLSHLPPSSVGMQLCACYLHVGDVQRGVNVGQMALDAAVERGLAGSEEYYRLGATLIWGHHELGNVNHAMSWARQLIAEVEQSEGRPGGAVLYWNAAILADSMGDVSEALHLSERALAQLAETDNNRDLIRLRLNLADIQLRAPVPQAGEALASLLLVKERLDDMANQVDAINWHLLAATASLILGRLDDAADYSAEAERLGAATEHDIRADVHTTAGDVAAARGDLAEAARHYTAAVEVLSTVPQRRGLVTQWRDLGDRFRELADCEYMARCYERALTTARIGDRSSELRRAIFHSLDR